MLAPPNGSLKPTNESRGTFGASLDSRGRNQIKRIRPLIGIAAAVAIWELIYISGLINHLALVSPAATISALLANKGHLGHALLQTLEAFSLGLIIGCIFGAAIGVLVAKVRVLGELSNYVMRSSRPLPALALIPVAILLAGIGIKMVVGLSAFAAFWPTFTNARYGLSSIDPLRIESGKSLGLEKVALFLKVELLSALPMIATGVEISIGITLIVTISVEMVAGSSGIGGFVSSAQQANATSSIYAAIVVAGTLGWILSKAYSKATALALPYLKSSRR